MNSAAQTISGTTGAPACASSRPTRTVFSCAGTLSAGRRFMCSANSDALAAEHYRKAFVLEDRARRCNHDAIRADYLQKADTEFFVADSLCARDSLVYRNAYKARYGVYPGGKIR